MTPDANAIGQEARRRGQFARWLVKAWIWAGDTGRLPLADTIEQMIRHADEEDYPLWEMATQVGLLGESKVARILREKVGLPIIGPKMTGWEREINFSPIITLDADVWDRIYNAMGWANRTQDTAVKGDNFYVWSPTGNIIRFIKRGKATQESDESEQD